MCWTNASATLLLARRLPNVVAPRSGMCGTGVSLLSSGNFSCASGGGLFPPPSISARWGPLGDSKSVNRRRLELSVGVQALSHGSPCTTSYAHIGMTSTSGSVTGARCSISWTDMDVFWLSFACCIIGPPKLNAAICAESCDIPSFTSNLEAIQPHVTPQLIRAHTRFIWLYWSRIWILWIMWTKSDVSVPHRYWLNICALGLSRITLDFSAIQWGRIRSKVALNACDCTFSNPSSRSSNLPSRAEYRERYATILLAGCQKIAAFWCVGSHRGCHLQEWVCQGKPYRSISAT